MNNNSAMWSCDVCVPKKMKHLKLFSIFETNYLYNCLSQFNDFFLTSTTHLLLNIPLFSSNCTTLHDEKFLEHEETSPQTIILRNPSIYLYTITEMLWVFYFFNKLTKWISIPKEFTSMNHFSICRSAFFLQTIAPLIVFATLYLTQSLSFGISNVKKPRSTLFPSVSLKQQQWFFFITDLQQRSISRK